MPQPDHILQFASQQKGIDCPEQQRGADAGDQQQNGTEPETTTDENGLYVFAGLAPGEYSVIEVNRKMATTTGRSRKRPSAASVRPPITRRDTTTCLWPNRRAMIGDVSVLGNPRTCDRKKMTPIVAVLVCNSDSRRY